MSRLLCARVSRSPSRTRVCQRPVTPSSVCQEHLRRRQQSHAEASDDDFVPPKITFLYKLKQGVSPSSFGLNVARLAGIKAAILHVASRKSEEMHRTTLQSTAQPDMTPHTLQRLYRSIAACLGAQTGGPAAASDAAEAMDLIRAIKCGSA